MELLNNLKPVKKLRMKNGVAIIVVKGLLEKVI